MVVTDPQGVPSRVQVRDGAQLRNAAGWIAQNSNSGLAANIDESVPLASILPIPSADEIRAMENGYDNRLRIPASDASGHCDLLSTAVTACCW